MFRKISMCLAVTASLFAAVSAHAQIITTTRVANGLSNPLYVTAPIGDNNRAFIVEQRSGSIGRIRVLDISVNPNVLSATIYLSISPVNTGNEEGLLGMAFHPNFLNNGYFFVYYTNTSGNNQVVRYQANAPYATSTTANAASATTILTLSHPTNSNHNGGWIGFAPGDTQGYLYIATGDGGSANDPPGNAQNINAYLGKLLRLDIDGLDNIPGNGDDGPTGYTSPPTNPFAGAIPGLDEIWAYGLRNPFRNSFDRLTGELYIGDVGQNAIEEVDVQPADVNGSMGGRNYGWRCTEGNSCTGLSGCTCGAASNVPPVHVYSHTLGRNCIIGGYVYRGPAIPSLQGNYFFADNAGNQIYTFQYTGSVNPPITERTTQLAPGGGLSITNITSFGEDNAGEMYICDRAGEVFKIIPGPPANDACANASTLAVGSTAFNTTGATTDGPDETGCSFSSPTQIGADIWYKFIANCTGTATVGVCGASFDTRMAAYVACPTAPGQMLACNDDFCGSASQVSFPVTSGTIYRVRVGGKNATTGTGTITLSCTIPPPPCPADTNGDNQVNVTDLLVVINNWGACKGCPADINHDNQVNVTDLLAVINGWGPCP